MGVCCYTFLKYIAMIFDLLYMVSRRYEGKKGVGGGAGGGGGGAALRIMALVSEKHL